MPSNVALLTQDPSASTDSAVLNLAGGGSTSQRPGNPPLWFHYYDLDLGRDVVWNGTDWIVSAGGPQGFQGAQGNSGFQGFQGVQGFQGAVGNTGSGGGSGTPGPQGFQGPSGAQGPAGVQGFQGFQGPAPAAAKFKTSESRSAMNSTIGHVAGVNVAGYDGSSSMVVIVTGLANDTLPSGLTIQLFSGASEIQSVVSNGSQQFYTFVVANLGNGLYSLGVTSATTTWQGIKTTLTIVAGNAYFTNASTRGAVVGAPVAGPFAIAVSAFGTPANTFISNARFVAVSGLAPIPGTTANLNGSSTNPRGGFTVNDQIVLVGDPAVASAHDAIVDFNF